MPTYTYSTPSSLSVCELSLAMTPSAPLLNPQVHERFLLRMVPHTNTVTRSMAPTAPMKKREGTANNNVLKMPLMME